MEMYADGRRLCCARGEMKSAAAGGRRRQARGSRSTDRRRRDVRQRAKRELSEAFFYMECTVHCRNTRSRDGMVGPLHRKGATADHLGTRSRAHGMSNNLDFVWFDQKRSARRQPASWCGSAPTGILKPSQRACRDVSTRELAKQRRVALASTIPRAQLRSQVRNVQTGAAKARPATTSSSGRLPRRATD